MPYAHLFSGPYLFGAGVITFMLSKEIWVIEHTFAEFVAFWIGISWLVKKIGPGITKDLNQLETVSMLLGMCTIMLVRINTYPVCAINFLGN